MAKMLLRSGASRGDDMMPQEFHLCCTKKTLLPVDDEGGLLQALEEDSQVCEVLSGGPACYNNII